MNDKPRRAGPLAGVRIVEFAGIGPGPYAAMLLADMGADVIRITRKDAPAVAANEVLLRNRPSIRLDLKQPGDAATAMRLLDVADGCIEGFRPGVMERLGLGPEPALLRNPRLVYGRMTGWGQSGPLAHAAGHDLNYIAITGALNAIGPANGKPQIPLNLLGDFGGGSLFLVMGLLAGIIEARTSGKGQVVDAAISDGVASLAAMFSWLRPAGLWNDAREANFLDGGAHYYNVYACSDGLHVTIGAIEPAFYAELCRRAGIDDDIAGAQHDQAAWPGFRARLDALFRTRTQAEWCSLLEGTDVCFAPVLDWAHAPGHPHNEARKTFVEVDGVVQPAPSPRFSRTPAGAVQGPPAPDADRQAVLANWGLVDGA